jgi:hypothetical protein
VRSLDASSAFAIVSAHRLLVGGILAGSIVMAGVYLHLAQYQYDVTLLVTPADNTGHQLPSGLQNLASMASLAGINLPGGDANDFQIYLDALTSRPTADILARQTPLMRRIFPDDWSTTENRWREPFSLVRTVTGLVKGIFGVPVEPWHPPGGDELHTYIEKNLSIVKTRTSPVVTITLATPDRQLGMDVLWALHNTVDQMLRQRQLKRSDQYIEYLTKELTTVTATELRQAIIDGLSEQEKVKMMASSNVPFVADPFGHPIPSTLPTSPKLLFVLGVAIFLGLVIGVLAALIREFVLQSRAYAASLTSEHMTAHSVASMS